MESTGVYWIPLFELLESRGFTVLLVNARHVNCRAAHPSARMEAITSRPLLLAAVGKAANHAGQTTLYLTPLHGRANALKSLIANVGAALRHVRAAAEQFKDIDPWATMLRYVSEKIAPKLGPFRPLQRLPATG